MKYGGQNYSKGHKKTSHWSLIIQNPVSGTTYPAKGEIDLMKYADESRPNDFFKRRVIAQEDLLGVLWLTKLKLL